MRWGSSAGKCIVFLQTIIGGKAFQKQYSCWLFFDFVGRKMALTLGKSTTHQSHFSTYKINARTSDFNTKLLKTIISDQRDGIVTLRIYLVREEY